MRLRRAEAVRYGAIEDGTLGDLADGLTVVSGPNEAGKSTYVALIRHVLYGFPTKAAKERSYLSAGGKRQGRLVFCDDEGEWVVERTEGPRGGPVTVRSPSGEARPDLLETITRGVSPLAFRVVFGFGLEDMAEIERLRGSDDDVIGRLYAASVGLGVSPADVRREIVEQAEAIFAPKARTKEINDIEHRMREVRTALRDIERSADEFRSDRERLVSLDADLEKARIARRKAREERDRAVMAVERLQKVEERLETEEDQATALRREKLHLGSTLDAIEVDEAALEAAPEVDVALERASAHERALEEIGRHDEALAEVEAQIGELERDAGDPLEALLSTPADAPVQKELERRIEHLRSREARAEDAGERAPEPTAFAGWTSSRSGGLAAALTGLSAGVIGVLLDIDVLAVVGVVVAAIGVAVLALARPSRAGRVQETETDGPPRALAQARAEWSEWAEGVGLPDDPTEARRAVHFAEKARVLTARRAAIRADLERAREETSSYARELTALAAGFLPGLGDTPPREVAALAARMRAAVGAAREQAGRRKEARRQADDVATRLAAAEGALKQAHADTITVLQEYDLTSGGLVALRVLAAEAEEHAEETSRAYDAVAQERSHLAGRLEAAAGGTDASELRLELAGLEERLRDAVERYAVLSVAARLLDRAQARYEEERQPEVVRRAQDIFRRMTGDRYVRLTIPLGGGDIEVYDEASQAKGSPMLSRGTVEQMYVALRLGLVGEMNQVGAALPLLMDDVLVDFDPGRARGAAQAVADLAETRQVVLFTCHPATVALFQEVADPVIIPLAHRLYSL